MQLTQRTGNIMFKVAPVKPLLLAQFVKQFRNFYLLIWASFLRSRLKVESFGTTIFLLLTQQIHQKCIADADKYLDSYATRKYLFKIQKKFLNFKAQYEVIYYLTALKNKKCKPHWDSVTELANVCFLLGGPRLKSRRDKFIFSTLVNFWIMIFEGN